MKAWVDYIWNIADTSGLFWKARGYGDWYAPGGTTDIAYIDQCFFIYSTDLLVRTASILDKKEDVGKYQALMLTLKTVFLKKYWLEGHPPDTQTAYVLALQFDLLPDGLRNAAAKHLVYLIHANHDHLGTGFLGT